MSADDYDCQACGACCIPTYDDDRYVELNRGDYTRLLWPRRNLMVVLDETPCGPRRCLRTKSKPASSVATCVCVALSGEPGERVTCTIYEQRPLACRQFTPGSAVCQSARAEIGLPAKPSGCQGSQVK